MPAASRSGVSQRAGATPDLSSILKRLEQWGAARDWVGPDPYEGLNAPLGRLARGARARQVVTQIYKRVPFSPPWPLRASPRPNAKALALVLSGYATPFGRTLPNAPRFREELPRRLRELNLLGGSGAAWGYHFDTQVRHIFYAKETPNAIATVFVVNALLDEHDASANPDCLELALRARSYFLDLETQGSVNRSYFAYVAAGSELVHNANALVCGTLARLDALKPDPEARSAATRCIATTIDAQRDDGLWPYGEAPGLEWRDNFHTAYVLEALIHTKRELGIGDDALRNGLESWKHAFIESDGWARYYDHRKYPYEAHSAASAIDLLCEEGSTSHVQLASRIGALAIRLLWISDSGCFGFRRSPRGLNRRVFMRWTNAPMFRSLSRLLST
jgi:hypothetical protein